MKKSLSSYYFFPRTVSRAEKILEIESDQRTRQHYKVLRPLHSYHVTSHTGRDKTILRNPSTFSFLRQTSPNNNIKDLCPDIFIHFSVFKKEIKHMNKIIALVSLTDLLAQLSSTYAQYIQSFSQVQNTWCMRELVCIENCNIADRKKCGVNNYLI